MKAHSKYRLIALILAIAALLTACGPENPPANPPENNAPTPAAVSQPAPVQNAQGLAPVFVLEGPGGATYLGYVYRYQHADKTCDVVVSGTGGAAINCY